MPQKIKFFGNLKMVLPFLGVRNPRISNNSGNSINFPSNKKLTLSMFVLILLASGLKRGVTFCEQMD